MFKTLIIGAIITAVTIQSAIIIKQEIEIINTKNVLLEVEKRESATLYSEEQYGDLTEAERGLCDYILYKGSSEDTTMEELVNQARANNLVCHWEY